MQQDSPLGLITPGRVRERFRKQRFAVYALRFVYFLLIIALLADILANNKPLYCKIKEQTYFPAFREYAVGLGLSQWPADLAIADWKHLKYESVLWPPIPFAPNESDMANANFKGPFAHQSEASWRWHHHFGTDALGRDILSGLIHGSRVALSAGLIAMGIAALIGIILGGLAGYFGDDRLRLSRPRLWINLLFLLLAWFYGFYTRAYTLSDAMKAGNGPLATALLGSLTIFFLVLLAGNLLAKAWEKALKPKKSLHLPVDILVFRFIEVLEALPRLLLLFALIALMKPSLYLVMAVIGLTGWTSIARFVRAELLRIRSLEYIETATALGYPGWRILFRHALPNALSPVLITLSFGIAGAILTESSLSFLGIGVPVNTISWGKMLSAARQAPDAWWMAIFPGLAIFLTVTAFNLLGEGITQAVDPKMDVGNFEEEERG